MVWAVVGAALVGACGSGRTDRPVIPDTPRILFRADGRPVSGPLPSGQDRPNVLIIAADTLRADALGAYGAHEGATPHLDRLAAEGIVARDCLSAATWTLPSFASLFTSVYAVGEISTGVVRRFGSDWPTLAEILAGAGYRTGALHGGGWLREPFGLLQGFQTSDGSHRRLTARIDQAQGWMQAEDPRPFFLLLHGYDTHAPHNAPEGYADGLPAPPAIERDVYDMVRRYHEEQRLLQPDEMFDFVVRWMTVGEKPAAKMLEAWEASVLEKGQVAAFRGLRTDPRFPLLMAYLRASYAREVAALDDGIGRLLDGLRQDGLLENTLVVFLSDHGEEFMEHDVMGHRQIYREVGRVPLLMRLPGGRGGGSTIEEITSLVDVMPTILSVVGLPVPRRAQGRNLLGPVDAADEPFALINLGGTWGIRTGDLSAYLTRRGRRDDWAVFDVAADPLEQDGTAKGRDALKERLRALGQRHRALGAGAAVDEAALTPELREELRGLGYLDDE